jgi:hypothetical protein
MDEIQNRIPPITNGLKRIVMPEINVGTLENNKITGLI